MSEVIDLATTKRGRPKKPGKREGSGRLQRGIDRGTEEVQAMRQALVGSADPALATYPLGVARARKLVTEAQHDAGVRLAALYVAVVGRRSPPAIDYRRELGGAAHELSEERLARLAEDYADARAALHSCGRRTFDLVMGVAVYEVTPSWLTADLETLVGSHRAHVLERRCRLTDGLAALAECFGLARAA